jgi:serine/threonine protein phosphatase PrpC
LATRLSDGTWLLAVADGIGGYEGGEVASAVTIATLREVADRQEGDLAGRLYAAVHAAHRRILELRQSGSTELRDMGTTLTALAVAPSGEAVCAHVGDSRLYCLRGGYLTQLTRDHNVGSELLESGLLTPEEMRTHPQRHMLTRAVGAEASAEPDLFPVALEEGDVYLLVTDGLVEALGEGEMARLAMAAGDWEEVGPALTAAAEARVAGDDATVVAVRVQRREGGP